MSNLAVRSVVALVGIPFLLWGALQGGFFFFSLVAIISFVALFEFYSLARKKETSPLTVPGLLLGFLLNLAFMDDRILYLAGTVTETVGFALPFPNTWQMLVVFVMTSVIFILALEVFRGRPSPLFNSGVTLLGLGYVSLSLGCLIGLRELFVPENFPTASPGGIQGLGVAEEVMADIDRWGGFTVASVFATIWICDSAAYFVGRRIGKRKLLERVSPNKTREGAIAGFVAAAGTFLLAKELFLPYLSVYHALAAGMIIGVFGQCGDLVESAVKREAGVKDSSSLIPGHGGMLDRFDSLIFASPALFLYFDFVVFAR